MSKHPPQSGIYCQCPMCRQIRDKERSAVPEYQFDYKALAEQEHASRTQREKCADGDHEDSEKWKAIVNGALQYLCCHCRNVYVPK